MTTNKPNPTATVPPHLHLERLLLERDAQVKRLPEVREALKDLPRDDDGFVETPYLDKLSTLAEEEESLSTKIARLNERIEHIEDTAAAIGLAR